MVAVLVDKDGIIRDCIIDGIATSVKFDATGKITSDLTKAPQTKNELGDNYGMVAYGGAKAEWNVQAGALAKFAVGKTVKQLREGAVDETGKAPAGSDLASSATIYLGGYVSAIETAVAKATNLGAKSGDTLKLATVTAISSSASATAEKAGTTQLDATVTALTLKDGVITSCAIDAVQAKVNFDATGKVTSDLAAAVKTKNELGKDYGMVAWGQAKFEWNEQAASFAKYVTGKTPAQVAGIAVNEKTAPTEADLVASVTIAIGDFKTLIAKAAK
jgi:predicted ATPase